jgi:hypothetical protein
MTPLESKIERKEGNREAVSFTDISVLLHKV